eukprot:TRINITY_DN7112_c0_g1_i1.p1 TRINITY_DN7112_c0_g1~~TRINITY_DN7112_c0_g1_i1.p1  ORF type:complete len:1449 (-),score=402.34 TRINITY_DN7112_c0_g1_i1:65-4234(-)
MERAGHLQVVRHELYQQPKRIPTPYGCLDNRMGVSDKTSECGTCGLKLTDCPGHFGYLKLELPVFHVGFFRAILQILQVICKSCSRLLLDDQHRAPYLRRMRNPNIDSLTRGALLKKLMAQAKRNAGQCPHCGAINGTVKKVGALKIVHDKYKDKGKTVGASRQLLDDFEEALKTSKDLRQFLPKAQDDINPLRALTLFRAMNPQDIEALDMDPVNGAPERLILTHLLVPPVCIRPSVAMDSTLGSNEDDLTMKIAEIIHLNKEIRNNMQKGATPNLLMEAWDFLQCQCGLYINADMPGIPPSLSPGKPIRGLCQRLKGKHGRFRGNLSGKRVDFSGRTVISPDPNLEINEVGVPELVAKTMTYSEHATPHNVERLRQYILNGPDVHPGANYVVYPETGFKRFLKFGNREKVASELKVGDVVERHLISGDVVLFNRQPSLHKISIMAHRARVMPWRTFRFNECVCTPYNADFDGDEMNLHVPQTEEARAESMELMDVTKNLQTPRTGDLLVASTQDFLTTSYLLTRRDTFYDRSRFCQLCAYMFDGLEQIEIPPPTVVKPLELWTGKQLYYVLLHPNKKNGVFLNMEGKARTFSNRRDLVHQCMCPNDGYVYFHNSELLSGTLDKASLGSGSKNCIFHVLMRDFSPAISAKCMTRVSRLSARWIGDRGFSIGIADVEPSARLTVKKHDLVNGGYAKCDELIASYTSGTLKAQSGMSLEQTLESSITKELSDVREQAGSMCLGELHYSNSPLIMALCGSKGSNINISQMIACVGQQTVNGVRIPEGFIKRTLPHFPIDSKIPAAKGFVANSFYTGMTASEFFFHTMAGREGLVDTAVKTAETGYMQRRLMKALEDLHVHYDSTVRNSIGGIVQFTYGEDNLDPAYMEAPDKPTNYPSVMLHTQATQPHPEEVGLTPFDLKDVLEELLASPEFRDAAEHFKEGVRGFLLGSSDSKTGAPVPGFVDALSKLRLQFGLSSGIFKLTPEEVGQQDKVALSSVDKIRRMTRSQLAYFCKTCFLKYIHATAEPGTAVGAIGAQSIGEPGTQMTLKTFHFAGVASMNITLGVPRIKEIINAARNISTPIITATLVSKKDVTSARIVKGRIEKTTLGEIAEYIKEVYVKESCYLGVKLDLEAVHNLQLELTVQSVKAAILRNAKALKLKLKEPQVAVHSSCKLRVFPAMDKREQMLFAMQALKSKLPHVIVSGIPGITRAVISGVKENGFNLLVEGKDLAAVMATSGIVGEKTVCNHIMEVERVLGVEAARQTIMNEIVTVMQGHGMSIDSRHVMLLADLMTYMGQVLGITRFGISKMKESVLMLASFERTTDFLFDAAVHRRTDNIKGVSECIIMGIPVPLGTGLFKLHQQFDAPACRPRDMLFVPPAAQQQRHVGT